jgi:hypothetical protein
MVVRKMQKKFQQSLNHKSQTQTIMNKIQEDTLNMYEATDSVLQSHAAIWTPNVPFNTAVGLFKAKVDAIEDLRDQQEEDTTGVAEDKSNKRQSLEDQTFLIGSIITAYASTTGNRELLQKVNFGRSELSKARDNELPGMSEQVHQAAVDNAVAILPYGVTALMTTALGAAITDFVNYISKPRAAQSEVTAATEQLPAQFEAATTLLEERIDTGMELFRAANPDFYAQYHNARIIVNSPTQKRALNAHFVDDTTGLPVPHVKVNVDGIIERRSSSFGNIRVQNLGEGGHSLTGIIPGFVQANENFNIISGETTSIEIRLVRV